MSEPYLKGHGGKVFLASELTGRSPLELLDFSSNINCFFDLKKVKEILLENIDLIAFYPDLNRAKRSLSNFLNVPKENLFLGNGSAELIFLTLWVLKPKKVLLPVPAFSEYERASIGVGAQIKFLVLEEENDFHIPEEKLFNSLKEVDLLILCNPNNPTGNILNEEILKECARISKGWLLIDEAFLEFVSFEKRPSLIEEIFKNKVILLRSLTKVFSIPGIRVGYLIGPSSFIEKLKELVPPWGINVMAQVLFEHLETLYSLFLEGFGEFLKEKESFQKELSQFLKVFPSYANFFMFKCSKEDLFQRLLEKGFLIRDLRELKGLGPGFYRVCVRRSEDNKKLIEALKEVLG